MLFGHLRQRGQYGTRRRSLQGDAWYVRLWADQIEEMVPERWHSQFDKLMQQHDPKFKLSAKSQDGTNEARKATAFVDRRWRQGSDNGVALTKHIMKSIKHRSVAVSATDRVGILCCSKELRDCVENLVLSYIHDLIRLPQGPFFVSLLTWFRLS